MHGAASMRATLQEHERLQSWSFLRPGDIGFRRVAAQVVCGLMHIGCVAVHVGCSQRAARAKVVDTL